MRFKGTLVLFVLLAGLAGWVYWTDIRGREEREQAEAAASKILPVDPEAISRITLVYPDRTIAAERQAGVWQMVAPEGLDADQEEWDRLAGNVPRLERDEVVVSGGDLEPYGLSDPAIRVDVESSDGTHEAILFGRENPQGTSLYAKLESSPDVFLSSASWAALVRKEVHDMRDKTLVHFDPETIGAVEIRRDGVSLRLRKEDGWRFADSGEPVSEGRVPSMLGALAAGRALEIIDDPALPVDYGLDSPALRVVLEMVDGAPLRMDFGSETETGAVGAYFRLEGDPAVKLAPLQVRDSFAVDRDELEVDAVPESETTEPDL